MELRFGTVSEFDAAKWLAKVNFEESELISGWLQVLTPSSQETKVEFPLEAGSLVACVVDKFMEKGVVLGTAYNEVDVPDAKSEKKYQLKYGDGTIIQYDSEAHKQSWKLSNTELILTQDGFTIKRSTESLKKIITDLIDQIVALTVTTPNGPSGTPINATAFTAIKNRLPNLFEA